MYQIKAMASNPISGGSPAVVFAWCVWWSGQTWYSMKGTKHTSTPSYDSHHSQGLCLVSLLWRVWLTTWLALWGWRWRLSRGQISTNKDKWLLVATLSNIVASLHSGTVSMLNCVYCVYCTHSCRTIPVSWCWEQEKSGHCIQQGICMISHYHSNNCSLLYY